MEPALALSTEPLLTPVVGTIDTSTAAPPAAASESAATPAEPTAEVDLFPDDPFATNVLPDYTFDPSMSTDDNFMVQTLIYTRLSISRRGNMAAIVTAPSAEPSIVPIVEDGATPAPPPAILLQSNNTPLPCPGLTVNHKHPELHAEARCITLAARRGISLEGATIYVSFPPCSACLQLIVGSGIKRAVYRRKLLGEESVALAKEEGVELVEYLEYATDEKMKKLAGDWWEAQGETKERSKNRTEVWWRKKGAAYGHGPRPVAEGGEVAAVDGGERRAKKQKGEKRKRD
jgi:deoxycytidylate deaminase